MSFILKPRWFEHPPSFNDAVQNPDTQGPFRLAVGYCFCVSFTSCRVGAFKKALRQSMAAYKRTPDVDEDVLPTMDELSVQDRTWVEKVQKLNPGRFTDEQIIKRGIKDARITR